MVTLRFHERCGVRHEHADDVRISTVRATTQRMMIHDDCESYGKLALQKKSLPSRVLVLYRFVEYSFILTTRM